MTSDAVDVATVIRILECFAATQRPFCGQASSVYQEDKFIITLSTW